MEKVVQYIYPAIFVKGEDEVVVSFPDISIVTDGKTFEEAFLFAKDYLKTFCAYAEKYDIEIDAPSPFEVVAKKHALDTTMLVDAVVFEADRT